MNTKFTKTVAATGLTVSAFVAVCGFTNTAFADDHNVANVNAHVAQSSASFNDYFKANKDYVEALDPSKNKSEEELKNLKELAHKATIKRKSETKFAESLKKNNAYVEALKKGESAEKLKELKEAAVAASKSHVEAVKQAAANGVGKVGSVNPSGSNDETDFSDDKVIESVARTGISFEEFKSTFITGKGKDGADKKISAQQIEKYNDALKTLRKPQEDVYNKNIKAAEMIRDNKVPSTDSEKAAANKFLEVKKGFGDKTFLQLTLADTKTAEAADKDFNGKLSKAVKDAIANYGKPVPSAPAPSVPAPAAPEVKAPAAPEAKAPENAATEENAPAAPEANAPENAAPEAKTPEVPATPEAPAAESPAEVAPEVPDVSEVPEISEAEEAEDWWTELVKYVDTPEFHELIDTIESDFTADSKSADSESSDSKSSDSKSADSADYDYDFEDLDLDELHSSLESLLDADFDALLAE